jgi:DNA-binding NarL/FixJ family response regulator
MDYPKPCPLRGNWAEAVEHYQTNDVDSWRTHMRILLADDQTKVRFALRVLLERQSGFQVVGEATDATDLFDQALAVCPDVILLDWELPGLGEESLADLREICPDVAVVALSGQLDVRQAAVAAGANTFVCKCDPPRRLLHAIEEAAGQLEHRPI